MTLKLTLLAAILSVGLVSGQDPTAQFKFNVITVKTVAGNPYFDEMTAKIDSPDTVSFKTPVKKDLPDNIMLTAVAQFAGAPLGDFEVSLCEAFENDPHGKEFSSHGLPKGVFPELCPVKAGSDYELSKIKVENDQIPPGFPDGDVVLDITLFEPGNDPYVTVHIEGALSHSVPGVPGIGR
ncbi:GSCOCG00010170001-RA-CDS [Cotesia congregata]|nr:GSCOCG00010170001-RA-CDS [Cotesia congregata]